MPKLHQNQITAIRLRFRNLKFSITDLSEDHATQIVRDIRENRRPLSKDEKKSKRMDAKADTLLKDLSPEDAKALLTKLLAGS